MSACLVLAGLLALQAPAEDVIIVTGDRAGEPAANTALAVSVIDEAVLRETGAHHPSELLNRVPGVNLHRGNGAEHLTAIRSPVLTGGAGAGAFLYLEDGIPLRAAGFSNVNGLFEAVPELADRVEVVRGPGPALYGSNALHGLINVISPDPEAAGDEIEVEAGSFGRYRGRVSWSRSGPQTQSWLGLAAQHEDGWREDAGLDRVAVRLRVDGETRALRWRFQTALIQLNQETAGFVRGTDAYRDRALARSNPDPEAFRDAFAARVSFQLDGRAGESWAWTATPYLRSNSMDFRMHFLPSEALEESGHDSAGVQLAARREHASGRVTIGLDLDQTRGFLRETQERPTIFSFVQGEHYDYTVAAGVAAVYVQARQSLAPDWVLHTGVRAERTEFRYDNHLASNTVGRFLRLPDRRDVFDTVTPSAGLVWTYAPDAQLFGRVARGVRAPQTAELYRLQPGQLIDHIEPETLDSVEIGWRSNLGTARFELTAFAMHKRNVFFRDADGINVTDGRTRHQGVEFAVEWLLADGWAFATAGSWAQHQYDFDRPVGSATETIVDGAEIDTAPNWLWNARLSWQVTPQTRLALDWQHVGAYYTDAANAHVYPGHDVLGLRARHDIRDGLALFATVRNVTDEAYAERADFAFGSERYFPGEGRGVSIGLRLSR